MVTRCTGSLSQLPVVKMSWGKNLRKKQVFWPSFIFWSISSDTLVPLSPWSPQVTRYTGGLSQLPVVKMSWGKKSKKKLSVLFHFYFWSMSSDTLVPWSPWLPGAQAAYLSFQWSKWAGGKKSKKKPSVLINFCFLVNFMWHTCPMVTMVTRCTSSLSQLPVVEMRCKKSKKKSCVLMNFRFLVKLFRHTCPRVTMVTRCTGNLSQFPRQNEFWNKSKKETNCSDLL